MLKNIIIVLISISMINIVSGQKLLMHSGTKIGGSPDYSSGDILQFTGTTWGKFQDIKILQPGRFESTVNGTYSAFGRFGINNQGGYLNTEDGSFIDMSVLTNGATNKKSSISGSVVTFGSWDVFTRDTLSKLSLTQLGTNAIKLDAVATRYRSYLSNSHKIGAITYTNTFDFPRTASNLAWELPKYGGELVAKTSIVPVVNQVLLWNGTQWTPSSSISASNTIYLSNGTIGAGRTATVTDQLIMDRTVTSAFGAELELRVNQSTLNTANYLYLLDKTAAEALSFTGDAATQTISGSNGLTLESSSGNVKVVSIAGANPTVEIGSVTATALINGNIKYEIENPTGAATTLDGRSPLYNIGSAVTTINLPEIVAGTPSASQVNPGTQFTIFINGNANAVTINVFAGDVFRQVNGSGTATTITNAISNNFNVVFTATDDGTWSIK